MVDGTGRNRQGDEKIMWVLYDPTIDFIKGTYRLKSQAKEQKSREWRGDKMVIEKFGTPDSLTFSQWRIFKMLAFQKKVD